jgi:hydroxyacylglutathione hydrolase
MANELEIIPLRAFNDNYIWLLRRGEQVVVVDPGDAAPVLAYLGQHALSVCAILATHHHRDHVGGIAELLASSSVASDIPVFGPAAEAIETVNRPLDDGNTVELPQIGATFKVITIPGHTRGHIAYYDGNLLGCGVLFCGDTLFACGCGRIFEGTAQQMWHSLGRLAALPSQTRVYCAHEYTEANIRFALAVEPDNAALLARAEEVKKLRAADLPSLPSTIAAELATNPFLRWDEAAVIQAAQRVGGTPVTTPEAVFTAIREWKNTF